MQLKSGLSYWLDRPNTAPAPVFPRHTGTLDVDVAIVGGGFTGCCAAETFAAAGVRVALLDRARVGKGSASASTALLLQEPDRWFRELSARYGRRTSRTIWKLSRQAVRDLAARFRARGCGLREMESLHVATDAAGADELRRDYRARRSAGLGGTLLDGAALRQRAGIVGTAAILTRGDVVVDPYRATLELATAARRAGAAIFERSPAMWVTVTRQGVSIRTPGGTVRSRWVIVATGFATPSFRPLIARFKILTTYVMATTPIDARIRRQMGSGRIIFWDSLRPYHYFRWADGGRILFGGGDRDVPKTARARRAALVDGVRSLRRKLVEFYPQLGSVRVSHAWDGLFATTPDGLPYIGPHRRYPRHLFALGYGGNGMTFGFLAARILLRYYQGTPAPTDALFGFGRTRGGS